MALTRTTEDYLQAIEALNTEGEDVIAARLADRLRVTPASVSQTIDRMVRKRLVAVGDDHRIALTQYGRVATDSIVRRHRLTERFLTDVLRLGWVEAHEEAHRLEHGVSDLVETRLSELLDHPATCPHGAPIPGNFPEGSDRDWTKLSTLETAERATIVRVSEMVEEDPELLQYCDDKNLRPGVAVQVSEIGPDRVFILDVGGTAVAVSRRLSGHIFCLPSASSESTP